MTDSTAGIAVEEVSFEEWQRTAFLAARAPRSRHRIANRAARPRSAAATARVLGARALHWGWLAGMLLAASLHL